MGRNQNPWIEANIEYLENNDINLLRRRSGGGTVYHDLGNLNISFIQNINTSNAKKNLMMVKNVLEKNGVDLTINERYDMRLDLQKVSGSAFYLHKGRKLHHCTLLVNVNEDDLWRSLSFNPNHYISRSIKSVKSPIKSIAKENQSVGVDSVIEDMIQAYSQSETDEVYKMVPSEILSQSKVINNSFVRNKEFFKSSEWIYGETPKFEVPIGHGFITVKNGKVIKASEYIENAIGHIFSYELRDKLIETMRVLKDDSTRIKGGTKMTLDTYDPLKSEMIQIMDKDGNISQPDLLPDISTEDLLTMYKTMVKSRVTDIKTLQFQRQGRILTYAPNIGQEAAQVGSIAASKKTDWMASAFRELGAWLYRGAPLYNILLYWLGNEQGMHMPEDVKILPVSIPIASQLQHATGLAYASVYKNDGDVVLGYVGDGGTSQGDFHEALNFASVMALPCVFIVQNNQFAISTRVEVQTKSSTIAQKAIAYGMPGYQVDGNDIFAMYAVTKLAVDRARNGHGPTLIEAYTYRVGAHTTSDDPTIYRDDAEVEAWKQKDPIDRLKKYLISEKLWDEDKDLELVKSYETEVKTEFEKVEKSGLIPIEEVFDHTYQKKTRLLEEELNTLKAKQEEVK